MPPRTFTLTVEGALGGRIETRLELSKRQHYDIYVSTTDAAGKPSESKLTLLEPEGRRLAGAIPVLPALGRVVASVRGLFRRRDRT